jgi:hypothetical protein
VYETCPAVAVEQAVKVPGCTQAVAVHPVGRRITTVLIAYAFELGLPTENVTTFPALPARTALSARLEMVIWLAFAARTGVTAGTRKKSPDTRRSARIVPELNFVTYAFVSVFNIFRPKGPDGVFKADGQIVHFALYSRRFSRTGG